MINAYSAYKKQSLTTLTPMEIVVKLYDEAERQMNRAIFYIGEKNYESSNNCLKKTQDIVNALRSVLDMDIPISKNLDSSMNSLTDSLLKLTLKRTLRLSRSFYPCLQI